MSQIGEDPGGVPSRPDALASTQRADGERLDAVRRAAQRWQSELLDTSGHNRLRRYRDLKTSTLDMTPGGPAGVNASALDRLLAGRKVRLSDIYSTADPPSGGAAPFEDARRRMAAIHKKALTNLEEKGIDTCFAGVGLATWKVEQGAEPNAPVILVPLHTVPTGAATRDFELSVAGDAHLNPVLAHLLRSEHRLDIDNVEADVAEDPPASLGAFDDLLDGLADAWNDLAGFAIAPRVVGGNFSYSTMPLVQDLDQGAEAFARNDLVAAIAGVERARAALSSRLSDPSPGQPNVDPPASEFLILDADSSQHLAINRVLGGESVVIQGPPGTGKSQTISNLIGTLVAHGKRVLFVAEKRAAIEAVTKRLDGVGLGDLVMDLHGGITSRREFARHLSASLDHIAAIPAQDHAGLHSRLKDRRDTLLADRAAVHDEREPWNLSVFDMRQRLLSVPAEARTQLRLSSTAAKAIDRGRFERLSGDIAEWVDLAGHELPASHPEWSQSTVNSPSEAQDAFEIVRELGNEHLLAAQSVLASCLDDIGASQPTSVATWRETLDSLSDVRQLLSTHTDDLYALDHATLARSLASAHGSKWARLCARLFSGSYRRACKSVRMTLRTPDALAPAAALDTLDRVARHLSTWSALSAGGVPRVPRGLDSAIDRCADAEAKIAALREYGVLTEEDIESDPAILSDTLSRLAASPDVAQRLPRIRELESGFGAAEIMTILDQTGRSFPAHAAVHAVEHAWLSRVLDDLSFADVRLSGFDSDRADRIRDEFAQFDRQHLSATPARLRRRIAESVIEAMDAHPDQATLIRTEAGKKRRHLSVRQLLARAPHVLTALRPCWTMSPVLTAEMIPLDTDIFDIVVFDEASQIPPAEAIGSLARAPQAVIAGDSRQLPPTTFFGRDTASDDDPDTDEAPIATDDIESLLEVADIFLRDTMLTWHYRSRDDRLIAFSNEHIYGGSLTAFPGSAKQCPLTHHLVPFRPLAEVNGTRSNPDEAVFVAERVLDHARRSPDETLGVIAFGQAHADAIENALMRALRELNDSVLDEFFSESNDERFFVKNIERVQGDERDVIVLSVGYHKDANGRLPYRFGPLNQEGGERRLNVAVTRARSRVEVVSSFGHHDMQPGRSSAQGVELLRQYLEYAATEARVLASGGHDAPLNPFELSVRAGLERRGIPATAQYGVSGYRIDFACAHPDKPGQMVLAIEADGASYHSAPTARDADRLRQQVLESKGWRFHRIWSTSWFNDKEAELDKAERAWRMAVRDADETETQRAESGARTAKQQAARRSLTSDAEAGRGEQQESPRRRGPRPYLPRLGSDGRSSIADYNIDELARLARWIESDSLLRTQSDLVRTLMDEIGFKRSGKRIVSALEEAIRIARLPQPPSPSRRRYRRHN